MTFDEWYGEVANPELNPTRVWMRDQARLVWDAVAQAEREACAALINIRPDQTEIVRIVKEDIRMAILNRETE